MRKLFFILLILSFANCNSVKKNYSRSETKYDSTQLIKQSAITHTIKDSIAKILKITDYNTIMLDLLKGGTVTVNDKSYVFPADSKITINKNKVTETKDINQVTTTEHKKTDYDSTNVKKQEKQIGKEKESHRFPLTAALVVALSIVLLIIILKFKKSA